MEHHVYNPEAGVSVHTNRRIEGSVTKPKAPVFWCEACELVLSSPTVALQHLRGRPHASKINKVLKREQDNNEPDNNEPAVKKVKVKEDPVKCEECKLEFTSNKTALEHFKGRRHAATLSKLKGESNGPVMRNKDSFQPGKGKGFRNPTGYSPFKTNPRTNYSKPLITAFPLNFPPHDDQPQENVQKMKNYNYQYKSSWVKSSDDAGNKGYGYSSYKSEQYSSPSNSPSKSKQGSNFSHSTSKQQDNIQYSSFKSNSSNNALKQSASKVNSGKSSVSALYNPSKPDHNLQNSGYSTYSNFGPKSYSFIASQASTSSTTSNGYYSEAPKNIPTIDSIKDHRVIAPPKKDNRNSSNDNYNTYEHNKSSSSYKNYQSVTDYSTAFNSESDSLDLSAQKSYSDAANNYSQSYSNLNLSSNYSKTSQYDTSYSSIGNFCSSNYAGTSNHTNASGYSNVLSNYGSSSSYSFSSTDYSTTTYSSMSNYNTSDYGSTTDNSTSNYGNSSSKTDNFKLGVSTLYSNTSNYDSSSSYNVNSNYSLDGSTDYNNYSNTPNYASSFISYNSYSGFSK